MGAGARTVEEDAGISPTHWLATMHQDGSPHVMPVWTFWVDSAFYFVSGATTRKSKNLAQNAHCVIAVASTGLDLIVEGEATKVYDETKLQQIADYSRDRLRPGHGRALRCNPLALLAYG